MKKPKNVEDFISLLETRYGLEKYPKLWNSVELYTDGTGKDAFGLILYKYAGRWRFAFVFCLDKSGPELSDNWTQFPGFIHEEVLKTPPIKPWGSNILGTSHTLPQKISKSYINEVLRLYALMKDNNHNLHLAENILKIIQSNIIDHDELLN